VLMNFFQMGFGSTGGTVPATTSYLDYIELNGTTWDFEKVSELPVEPALTTEPVPTMSQWALITILMLIGLTLFTNRKRLF
jgi:hypothetical protein